MTSPNDKKAKKQAKEQAAIRELAAARRQMNPLAAALAKANVVSGEEVARIADERVARAAAEVDAFVKPTPSPKDASAIGRLRKWAGGRSEVRIGPPWDEDRVAAIEHELAVQLAPSYRTFLRTVGRLDLFDEVTTTAAAKLVSEAVAIRATLERVRQPRWLELLANGAVPLIAGYRDVGSMAYWITFASPRRGEHPFVLCPRDSYEIESEAADAPDWVSAIVDDVIERA